MATQKLDAKGGVQYDLNSEFSLVDGTSYLLSCNDATYTVLDVADGDDIPDFGIERLAKNPFIIKPVAGQTIRAWVEFGGTLVVTEAP